MPSDQFVLAYYSRKPLDVQTIEVRAGAAEDYALSLHRKPCVVRSESTGAHTGIIAWRPCDDTVGWPQFASAGDESVAWVGIPEHDALGSEPVDPLVMARNVVGEGFDVDVLGAPFACIYRTGDELRIVNDSLGMARLYEFDFGDIVVWATRPGLAHVFAARHVEANSDAWSGMATLGWNVGGHAHLGLGKQVPGSLRIAANSPDGLVKDDRYAEWVSRAPSKGASWEAASAGMVRAMSLGRYFSRPPIADLSGGKDSRLLAAAALTSGVTETVRTVRSDHGDVETAQLLVEAYPGKVTHLITEVAAPAVGVVEAEFSPHVTAMIRGTEGAAVPFAALRGRPFRGYDPLVVSRFNGHGGEALHGGEYLGGAWRDKLANAGMSGAIDRMAVMVGVARGTSDVGRERTMETVRGRLELGASMGLDSAYGLLNYFYSAERMPFWASSSPNRSVITPYYSSGLLHHIARTFTEDTNFNDFYSEILSSLVPAWSEVPFYRPNRGARRASRFFWENFDWQVMRRFILDRADASEYFDADGIAGLVADVDSGSWSGVAEVPLARFLWEVSFESIVEDINGRVDRVLRAG